MTESLDDKDTQPDEAKMHQASTEPAGIGFWDRPVHDLDHEPEPEPEPTAVDDTQEEEVPDHGDASSWLSLSRKVDGRVRHADAHASSQGLASQFPKVRGGRVVVRDPVKGWVPEDSPDYDIEDDADVSDQGGVEEARVQQRPEPVPISSELAASLDDLDEPFSPRKEEEVEPLDPYLPADAYVEENPFELAMADRHADAPQDDQIWLDGSYETIEEEPSAPSADEADDEWMGLPSTQRREPAAPAKRSAATADEPPAKDSATPAKPKASKDAKRVDDLKAKLYERRFTIIVVSAIVLAILLVVYIVGIVRVSGKFLPNTKIGDRDVSGLTRQEAEAVLTESTGSYVLSVTMNDFTAVVDGASVSVDRDEVRIANEAYELQTPFMWPIALLFGNEPAVDQAVTYDNVKFDQQITDAVEAYNQKTLPTTAVAVALDTNSQTYGLKGSVDGEALDTEVVLAAAHDSIAKMKTKAVVDPKVALRQAVPQDLPQYEHAVANANIVRGATISITVDGKQVAQCTPIELRSWVTVTDEPAVAVNDALLAQWAESTLAPTVYKDGEWGEVFLDTDKFVQTFSQRLKDGEPGPFEAITYDELNREGTSRQKAYKESPWNKKLGRYIDVDLTAQFARLFDKSGKVIWESAFVSGDMAGGHQTITGTYQLFGHELGQLLVGADYDGDGQPDYESYVNFWMPFYAGYGLHDATWRSSFGGDLYMYNGSHGCINLPYEKAEELFGMTAIGDTVYVHE